MKKNSQRQLIKLLKELHLPMFREYYAECASKAMQEGLSYPQYLFEGNDFAFTQLFACRRFKPWYSNFYIG